MNLPRQSPRRTCTTNWFGMKHGKTGRGGFFGKTAHGWIFWKIVDNCPRRDLENEPPPPRKIWRCLPAGPRNIGASLRECGIAVHPTAKSCYEREENPVAAEECSCRAALARDI